MVGLPGIRDRKQRSCLVEQLLESIRRVKYVKVVRKRDIDPRRADPNNELFDPLRASMLHEEAGEFDEASWLVFLFVHFGKHAKAGWRYLRDVYGCLGLGGNWTWARTSSDPAKFRAWVDSNLAEIKRGDGPQGFGNHRKYQSLDAYSNSGTGSAVETYVHWVNPSRSHKELFAEYCVKAQGDRKEAFDTLYRSMDSVASFGRTARFDYLAMIGKLGLAPIEPGSAYIRKSTGPAAGARLLFHGDVDTQADLAVLDGQLQILDEVLNVGMQVLEDALCNWQKSPGLFRPFRG